MRKSTITAIAIAFTLILASQASAFIHLTHSPGISVGDNLMSYTISLVSDDRPIGGFDGLLYGQFNQVLAFDVMDTPTMEYSQYGVDLTVDTHFLFHNSDLIALNVSEGPTYLQGAFVFRTPSTRIDLAQIVIPSGQYFNTDGKTFDSYGTTFPLPMFLGDLVAADAGGPYTIDLGETLTLGGEMSFGSWFGWDLDGDGVFNDAAGESPNVTYDYLVNTLSLSPGEHTIAFIAVRDNYSYIEHVDYTTLTIVPEPISFVLMMLCGLLIRRRK